MNVNKKFDRFRQRLNERMGTEKQLTDTNDTFKALEMEMQLRHEGLEKMKKSSDAYLHSMSKRERYQDKEQLLPIGYFGSTLVAHGDDYEPDSEFGQCLTSLGRANERMARMQETYCANANSSWGESLERSLVQMKEYQKAKKQLESRRLAYDTAATKMQKSKKDDFRMEEELRSQKLKYEESSEDVYRRMLDIKEAEGESIQDLTSFLEAELAYYDRCREVLLQLHSEWPAQTALSSQSGTASPANSGVMRRIARSRAGSTNDHFDRFAEPEKVDPPVRPTIRSHVTTGADSPRKEYSGFDLPVRSSRSQSTTGFEGPTALTRTDSHSPARMPRLSRVPTEPISLISARSNLRTTTSRTQQETGDVFGDDQSDYGDYATSYNGSQRSLTTSLAAHDGSTMRKAPPPPPPSRSKKPPPPPPMKRSALSTSEMSYH